MCGSSSGSALGAPSWCSCSWSGVSSRSCCSGVSLSSGAWVFLGSGLGVSSSLLDSYSEDSSSWSWAGVCSWLGVCSWAGGWAAFFAGAAGLGFADGPGAAAGALVQRPLGSLEVEMVASLGEQVSPGVCSRPFDELGGVPVLQGQGRRRVISPLPKIKGCT